MDHDPELDGLLDLTAKKDGTSEHDGAQESDDEIQDWSTVASVSKRGPKEFEPLVCEEETKELSEYDQNALSRSRNMMFSALGKDRGTLVSLDDIDKCTIYINDKDPSDLFMTRARGKFLESMGQTDKGLMCHFGYEEAIYLVERGTCLARLHSEDPDTNARYQKMLPLSLESVYSLLIQDDEQLDRYMVYSLMKRNGYIVTRHREFDHVIGGQPETALGFVTAAMLDAHNKMSWWTSVLAHLSGWMRVGFPYRLAASYFNIFTYLSHTVRGMVEAKPKQQQPITDYYITYNVWKPMANFKKKNPPLPDFQVAVVKAWSDFPRVQDLKYLVSRAKTNPETFRRKVNRRTQKVSTINSEWDYSRSVNMHNLKYNDHNITFAVVDNGIVNFAHISDCCFATEGPCWRDHWATDSHEKKGKKKGGKRGPRRARVHPQGNTASPSPRTATRRRRRRESRAAGQS